MRKSKAILDQYEMERLIYNDLDIMKGYPDYLKPKNNVKVLKERIEELKLPGEKVSILGGEFTNDYAITSYGRLVSGKRVSTIAVTYDAKKKEHYTFINAQRMYIRDLMEDNNYTYDYDTVQQIGEKNGFKLSLPYKMPGLK